MINNTLINIPEWIRWVAMDSNGWWAGYRDKPILDICRWESKPSPDWDEFLHYYNIDGTSVDEYLHSFCSYIPRYTNYKDSLHLIIDNDVYEFITQNAHQSSL